MLLSTTLACISTKLFAALFSGNRRRIAFPIFILFTGLLSMATETVTAQTAGDYRSIINGGLPVTVNWEDASTWERYDGTTWNAAIVAPDFNDGVITVQSPTYIKINSNLTIDQTVIQNGATIQPQALHLL
jgi:hypothetical protein